MFHPWTRAASLAVGLVIGAVAVSVPTDAHATSFAPMSTEMFVDASTYIVRGTVTAVWTERDDRGLIWTRARVEVSDVMKGPGTPDSLVVDSLGGEFAGERLVIAGQAVFSIGEEAVFFLAETGPTGVRADNLGVSRRLVPVSKFQGVRIIRRAPGERESYTLTWQAREGEKFDARFLPHPVLEQRVYLQDLTNRIGARLTVGWDGQAIPGLSPEKLAEINAPDRRSH